MKNCNFITRKDDNTLELNLETSLDTSFTFLVEYEILNLTEDSYNLEITILESQKFIDGDEVEYSINVDMYHIVYDIIEEHLSDVDFWSIEEYRREMDNCEDYYESYKLL
jgi:hypothetical protein